MTEITNEMVEAGLQHYSEGGCCGLADYERREVVHAILTAAENARKVEPIGFVTGSNLRAMKDGLCGVMTVSNEQNVHFQNALYSTPPQQDDLRKAVKIARDFGEEELRGTPDFIRGAAYASESIALAIEDATRSASAGREEE